MATENQKETVRAVIGIFAFLGLIGYLDWRLPLILAGSILSFVGFISIVFFAGNFIAEVIFGGDKK